MLWITLWGGRAVTPTLTLELVLTTRPPRVAGEAHACLGWHGDDTRRSALDGFSRFCIDILSTGKKDGQCAKHAIIVLLFMGMYI